MPNNRTENDARVARLKRLLAIVPMARRRGGVSLDKLTALFDRGIEEIFDDVRLLIMCGVPPYGPNDYIQAYIEDGRLYLNFADRFVGPVRLTADEYAALAGALEYSGSVLARESRCAADGLLSKISAGLAGRGGAAKGPHRIFSSAAPRAEKLSLIKECISSQAKLDIEYYSAGSETLRRHIVHPLSIMIHSYHWYVLAFDELREEVRVFRGDRILGARRRRGRFRRPDDFDPRGFLGPRLFDGEHGGIPIKVLFVPEYARFISERFPSHTLKKRRDGSVVVEMKADGISWAARWVLKHGAYARALAPGELVEEVDRRCGRMLRLYEKTCLSSEVK